MFGYFGAQAPAGRRADNFIDPPAGVAAFIATGATT